MAKHWICALILLTTLQNVIGDGMKPKNVLALFPHHGFSHFKVFYPVMRELAQRGHHVTVVTYIKSNDRPMANYDELLLQGRETVNVFKFEYFPATRSLHTILEEYFILHEEGQESCETFYQSSHVATILQRHKHNPYDLVISEFFNTDCYLGIAHALNVPVIGFSSCVLMPFFYDRIALPDTPSFIQSEFVGYPEVLNWEQRLTNFIQMKLTKLFYRYYTNVNDNHLIAKYLNISMDVDDFAKRSTALLLVNQHYALSGTRPQTPQLVDIGGVHLPQPAVLKNLTLPTVILEFLNQTESEQSGVLFISWGSMLRGSSLPIAKLNAIIDVLLQQPMKVIWKWETDDTPIPNGGKILFVKWAPQIALLCHSRVRLFWGHGGLLGTTEAAYCGKPMLLTPIYGDQFLNANKVESRKAGLIMPHNELEDRALLKSKLHEVSQRSYLEGAQTLSYMFRQRQNTPLETAIWWIEHVLAHKEVGAYLRNEAVHLNWFVYHSLDSIALLLLAIATVLLLTQRLVILACEFKQSRSRPSKTNINANTNKNKNTKPKTKTKTN